MQFKKTFSCAGVEGNADGDGNGGEGEGKGFGIWALNVSRHSVVVFWGLFRC